MENRTTLKNIGLACIAIGLVWYIFSQIAPLIQAELVKLEIARDIERAKDAADDQEKIIEEEQERSFRLARQLEKEKRLRSEAEAQLMSRAPVLQSPRAEKYRPRFDIDYRPRSAHSKAPASLPARFDIEKICAHVAQVAAHRRRRIVYRNSQTNIRVVADPTSCGRVCVQVQLTVWEKTHLRSRKMMIFGPSRPAYNIVRLLGNFSSSGFRR